MKQKTWIYLIILIAVLVAAGIFFWWNYRSGQVQPKASTPTTVTQTFSDVPMGDPNNNYAGQYWAFNQIEAVNQMGWMVGWDVQNFRPTENTTRAAVAAAVAKAYGLTANPDTPSFTDVPKDYWAYQEIEGLKAAGYIPGTGATIFKPGDVADRGTLAAFVAKAHAGGNVPEADIGHHHFSDCVNVVTCPYYNEIEYLAGLTPPVIGGFDDGTFKPGDPADRQTLAVILAKDHQPPLDISSPPAEASFNDVAPGTANYAYIEAVKTAGYLVGYSSKEFRPDLEADRATVAAAVAHATGNSYDNPTPTFPDVPVGQWAYKEIEGMKKAGLMNGYPDGNFRPGEIATRYTVAVVLARAKNLTLEPNGAQIFADVKPGDDGYAEINAIYKAKYTSGCGVDAASGMPNFCPGSQITRAVLAAFVYNAFIATSPSPVPAPSATPTPTAATTARSTAKTATTTATPAKTGAELPLASAGILTTLFAVRYLIGRRIR